MIFNFLFYKNLFVLCAANEIYALDKNKKIFTIPNVEKENISREQTSQNKSLNSNRSDEYIKKRILSNYHKFSLKTSSFANFLSDTKHPIENNLNSFDECENVALLDDTNECTEQNNQNIKFYTKETVENYFLGFSNLKRIFQNTTNENNVFFEEVLQAFCLDLEIGKKWKTIVLHEMNNFFERNNQENALEIFKEVVKKLNCENVCNLKKLMYDEKLYDKSIILNFKYENTFTFEQRSRLIIIINELFYLASSSKDISIFSFEKFDVYLDSSDKYQDILLNSKNLKFYKSQYLPRIILSNAVKDFENIN